MVPVILDVDTGVDDAFALLLAARHTGLDLLAVTCVAGNARVLDVARNTLTVLEVCGRPDVPVAIGADRPLRGPAGQPRSAHGTDGMGDLGWPAPTLRPHPRPAVGLLREILLSAAGARQPVTLVTLGPLTNVAALFSAEPGVAGGLREIIVMGGAFGPEEEARKDFNIRHDPEAAWSTLESAGRFGIPVTMYTLDVFLEPRVSRGEAARLVAAGGHSPSQLAGRLLAFHCNRFVADEATIGDAGAVCAVLDPGGLAVEEATVRVDLTDRPGRTFVAEGPDGVRVSVATGVDGPRYAALWLEAVG